MAHKPPLDPRLAGALAAAAAGITAYQVNANVRDALRTRETEAAPAPPPPGFDWAALRKERTVW